MNREKFKQFKAGTKVRIYGWGIHRLPGGITGPDMNKNVVYRNFNGEIGIVEYDSFEGYTAVRLTPEEADKAFIGREPVLTYSIHVLGLIEVVE